MNKILSLAVVGVLTFLVSCQQEPAEFEVPASTNYHEPDKAFLMYVPAGDVTLLRNVASVTVPAFNERRKLTSDESRKVAQFYDEYRVYFQANERSRAAELMSFYTDHPGFSAGVRAAECDRRIASIAGAFNLMRSAPGREEATSDKEFNQWLGALFNADKTMARTMLAFCSQVLKVKLKHPDLSEQPVVFKSGFKLEGYAPDGTQQDEIVAIAFPKAEWDFLSAYAKTVVSAGRDAFGPNALPGLREAADKAWDLGREQLAWGNMNVWAYPEAGNQPTIWPPYRETRKFTNIFEEPGSSTPDFDRGWAFLQVLASDN